MLHLLGKQAKRQHLSHFMNMLETSSISSIFLLHSTAGVTMSSYLLIPSVQHPAAIFNCFNCHQKKNKKNRLFMCVMFVLSLFPLHFVAFCFYQYNNFFTSLGLKIFCDIIKNLFTEVFFLLMAMEGNPPTVTLSQLTGALMLLVMYFFSTMTSQNVKCLFLYTP